MVKTRRSAEIQLEHELFTLRLNRSDNMGIRDSVPSVMLTLGKDQEAYDFIKWYETDGSESDYDWGDMDLPFLSVRDADVFEDVDFCSEYSSLAFTSAITLLKIKFLLDLQDLQNSKLLRSRLPTEILADIQARIPRSSLTNTRDILGRDSHLDMITALEAQIRDLHATVRGNNVHFWPALLSPGQHLTAKIQYTSRGSKSEASAALQDCYDAWVATPGALDYIRRYRPGTD